MAFQDIKKVESDQFYLDVAFRRATEKADKMRGTFISEDRLARSKQIESAKVKVVKEVLDQKLSLITRSFPDLDDLHQFYRELIRASVDWKDLKKSLGAVKWARDQIVAFGQQQIRRIHGATQSSLMNKQRREYYGRCASILKQIRTNLAFLEHTRLMMQRFPTIRTGLPTVAIVGFPNVGKTTLLYRLTGSRAEINSYAFTTKGINVGYLTKKAEKEDKEERLVQGKRKERSRIQLLDTPGTLNRPDKMNAIEKVAHFALELLADKAVYVFDLTEPFPLDDQIKLYKEVQRIGIPTIPFLSKTDILPREEVEEFCRATQAVTSLDEVKKFIE